MCLPEMQKWKVDKELFVVERKFSIKPYQAVKLSEIIGIVLLNSKGTFWLALMMFAAAVFSWFVSKALAIIAALFGALVLYEYWEKGKVTLLLTKAGAIELRGHHPELKDLIR